MPCALPPILWLHRKLRLRSHDEPPTPSEIVLHVLFWSLLFEWIGPGFMPGTTGDPFDVLVYIVGAAAAALWWHRGRIFRRPTGVYRDIEHGLF